MAPSCSLPTTKKRKPTCDQRPKKEVFMKRVPTLKKKSMELSTLCDVSVCLICYGPEGELHHWPENRDDVRQILAKFKGLSEKDKKKHMVDLGGFMESERVKAQGKKKKNTQKNAEKENIGSEETYPDFDKIIKGFSDDELKALVSQLDGKVLELNERMNNLLKSEVGNGREETRVPQIEKGINGGQLVEAFDIYGELGNLLTDFQFPVNGSEVNAISMFSDPSPTLDALGNYCGETNWIDCISYDHENYDGFMGVARNYCSLNGAEQIMMNSGPNASSSGCWW